MCSGGEAMEFVLIVLSVIACFAAGFVLLKPETRKAFPTGFLGGAFYVEGLWLMLNYIISGIWADSRVMQIIKCAINVIIAVGTIYSLRRFNKIAQRKKKLSQKYEREDGISHEE